MISSHKKLPLLITSLYTPWILAVFFWESPILSFWIAWLGSLFIFYQTWSSSLRFILPDFPVVEQNMRPIFLQQFIFAGFMCCTSIFYFLDTLGYVYFEKVADVKPELIFDSLYILSKCQQLSVLAHAAFVTGILILQRKHFYNRPRYILAKPIPQLQWLLIICIITFALSLMMQRISGLFQFSIGLYNVAIFSGSVIFIRGIRARKIGLTMWGAAVFLGNLINSTLTGYKEHIIVNCIILTCLTYPYYKKTVLFIAVPCFFLLFYVLPTYAAIIRENAWTGNLTPQEARSAAIQSIFTDRDTYGDTNWSFLADRLSEIGMFTGYVATTPSKIPFYNLEILKNSLSSIIPRTIWKDKPITEYLAMERVYDAGVVDVSSTVSAKTRPVVDGYLSAGMLGVFLYMLFLGILSQTLSNFSENYLGGYEIGCVVFFNGFFQILWRGETMEFLLNSVFWSFVAMLCLFFIVKAAGFIQKVN